MTCAPTGTRARTGSVSRGDDASVSAGAPIGIQIHLVVLVARKHFAEFEVAAHITPGAFGAHLGEPEPIPDFDHNRPNKTHTTDSAYGGLEPLVVGAELPVWIELL